MSHIVKIDSRFATAEETADILGVSPSRATQLIKIWDTAKPSESGDRGDFKALGKKARLSRKTGADVFKVGHRKAMKKRWSGKSPYASKKSRKRFTKAAR